MDGKRVEYFDNLKAILIFLVVFGHLLITYRFTNEYASVLINFIYVFHMPLFIFISGYFSKYDKKNVFTNYLIPYLFFNYLYFLLFPPIYGFRISLPIGMYWFLISLICWKLIIKYIDKIKGIFIISLLIARGAGVFEDITAAFSFSRTLKFLPFFVLGYKFKKEWFWKIKEIPKIIFFMLLIATLTLFFVSYKLDLISYDMLIRSQSYHLSGFTNKDGLLITTFIITPLTFLLIFITMYVTPKKRNLFTYIGKNTMVIYLIHGFFYEIYLRIFSKYGEFNCFVDIILAFLFSVLLCLVLGSNSLSKIYKKVQNKIDDVILRKES
mgnify:CR=1 FL=1